MNNIRDRFAQFSFFQLFIISALTFIGFLTILAFPKQTIQHLYAQKFTHVFLAYIIFFTLAFQDRKIFYQYAYILHITTCLLLLLSFLLPKVNNTHRWLCLGPLHIQVSEFVKISMVLALARYSESSIHHGIKFFSQMLIPLLIVSIPCLLILMQPDLGTAITLFITGVIVCYVVGTDRRFFIMLTSAGLLSAPIAWFYILHPYQKMRILTFLSSQPDISSKAYQIRQSLIAVGSGALWGKGWGKGTQTQLSFLPEKHTDFIFAAWAEEFGFFGSLILITLILCFVISSLLTAQRAKNPFASYTCVGLSSCIALYSIVNIAMVTGFLPVVGIPLPFVSYGGSSLLSSFIAAAIISSMHQTRYKKHI